MATETPERLKSFSEIAKLPIQDRPAAELKILDGLIAAAVKEKDWNAAMKIFERAHQLIARTP